MWTVGQRVMLTKPGIEQRLQGKAPTPHGTIRGIMRKKSGVYLKVQRDGIKGVEKYWPGFWQPLPTVTEQAA